MSENNKAHCLPNEVTVEIDRWLKQYPADRRRSAVLPALHIVQDHNQGWLTNDLIEAVADYLLIPRIQAFEVATFYTMYELQPVGKHKICLCTNISCMLQGSDEIADYLKQKLKVGFGETTSDGKFTLKEVECLGACVGAPMMLVDKKYHEYLTPESIDKILAELE